MDYLQYLSANGIISCSGVTVLNLVINGLPSILSEQKQGLHLILRFKPCYKWITFNTLKMWWKNTTFIIQSFKPCYKWITFNTTDTPECLELADNVLNLVINGLPSIPRLEVIKIGADVDAVLNLVINGLPSIQHI